jgi:hypothetical protein
MLGSGPLRAALEGPLSQESRQQLIGKTPFLHDCVKRLRHLRNATILDEGACLEFVPDDDGRRERDRLLLAREQAQHRRSGHRSRPRWTLR